MNLNKNKIKKENKEKSLEEKYYMASQWQLMGRKFKKHKLAVGAGIVLIILYLIAIFCEFIAPYGLNERRTQYILAPPHKIHFISEGRIVRPFVYELISEKDPETLSLTYKEDMTKKYDLDLFIRGDKYKFWGLFETDLHLFGAEDGGTVFLFGTDRLSRDMFSRIVYGTRISLSIGLVGVFLTLILGLVLGGISGYFGGIPDIVIQRVIEILRSFPAIPLWLALSAAIPEEYSAIKVYFIITMILALIRWTELARIVRGKLLSLREEDYVMAAKLAGCSSASIISRHLIPGFLSYIIVNLTLAVPWMILAETSLSFLGIGLRPPVTSWGVLLIEAQNVRTIAFNPWLLLPVVFVIITVLSFNFLGDGLRDAADPYK